jgi:hypothetical protein
MDILFPLIVILILEQTGFVFVNEKFVQLLSSKLGQKIEKLPFPPYLSKDMSASKAPALPSLYATT